MRKKTTEEFIAQSKEKFGDRFEYSKTEYTGSFEPVIITCPIHGDFRVLPHEHLRKYSEEHGMIGGCPECFKEKNANGNNRRLTEEEFAEKAKKVHGNKYDYSKSGFINTRKKVTIICPKHGEFRPTANLFLRGSECPFCKQSKLEKHVADILYENGIEFEREKTFEWLKNKISLRLDFFLPDKKIAIECQGRQHFVENGYFSHDSLQSRIENDAKKRELCEQHGIKLLYFGDSRVAKFGGNIILKDGDLLNLIGNCPI